MYNEYMYYKNITKYGYQDWSIYKTAYLGPLIKVHMQGQFQKRKISLDYIITVQGLKLLKAI